jgi:hypothetical protein
MVTVNLPSGIPGQVEFNETYWETVKVECTEEAVADHSFTEGGHTGGGGIAAGPGVPVFNTPSGPFTGEPVEGIYFPGGSGGNPPRPVITKPLTFVDFQEECNKITAIMTTGTYRQDLQNLATMVNDPINENGICLGIGDDVTVPLTPGPEVVLPVFGHIRALSHTHNQHLNQQGLYDGGTYSVFSYEDLVAIAKLIKQNRINTDNFVATLSTKKGTHYAMTISNITKFKKFFYHEVNDYADLDPEGATKYGQAVKNEEEISKKYFRIDTGLIKKQNTDNEYVLGKFLDYLNEADMGVMLFETDATFQTFTRVSKRSASKPIQRTPCQ